MRTLTPAEALAADLAGLSVGVLTAPDQAARIVPFVAGSARSVKVFQQEPIWVLPLPLPVARTRLARLNLRLSVKDAWTRRLLTPGRFGRRDVLVSPAYYSALQAPHVKLVAWPVYAVVEDGVRTAEGIEHRFDVLVTTHATRSEIAA